MAKKFLYTPENIVWFESFLKSNEFSEALGIVWKYGYKNPSYFQIRHRKQEIVERFKILIKDTTPIKTHYRKDKDFTEWSCNISLNHPFLQKIKQLGWTPLGKQERMYPKGEINHDIFIKTYILMRHDVELVQEKKQKKIVKRARLRLHGSTNILQHINLHLHTKLNVSLKTIQTHSKVNRTKTLYYQSTKEIPIILEYIRAWETLEKFNSFTLLILILFLSFIK